MGEKVNTALIQSQEILKSFDNIQAADSNMQMQTIVDSGFPINGELRSNEMCFYMVRQLAFDEDYPHREAFENILSAMDNRPFNFVYILTGTE